MKHHLKSFGFIAAGLLASASLAHAAAPQFYFSGYMGLNVSQEFSQSEPAHSGNMPFAGAMGFHLAPRWRMEGEIALKDDHLNRVSFNSDDSPLGGKFKTWSGFVNIYRDFGGYGKIEPFLTTGAGYITEETTARDDHRSGVFAWQLGGGVKYNFDPSLSFSSAYRYLDSVDSGAGLVDSEGHELHMGFSYKLPIRPKHHPRGLNDISQ